MIVRGGTRRNARNNAHMWRRSCSRIRGRPTAATIRSKLRARLRGSIGVPCLVVKAKSPSCSRARWRSCRRLARFGAGAAPVRRPRGAQVLSAARLSLAEDVLLRPQQTATHNGGGSSPAPRGGTAVQCGNRTDDDRLGATHIGAVLASMTLADRAAVSSGRRGRRSNPPDRQTFAGPERVTAELRSCL